MKAVSRVAALLLALCLIPITPLVYAEGNILQNQAVNGGTINQNIIFVDVDNHWASDAIYDMAEKGIISGYEDSSFKPENSITREEFAKLIAVTFYLNLNNSGDSSYYDVQPDRWSFPYIEASKDFLTGYYPPQGQPFFSPSMKATREDVAVALVKVLGYTADDLEDPYTLERNFNDVNEISYGLRDYVAIATEKQLISGYEDYTFRPEKAITRAEVATLLYRVIKSSSQDQANGPLLEVSMPKETTTGTFYIEGRTSKDAKVAVNGIPADVEDGSFKEGFALDEEGVYDITIVAKLPSGKTTTVRRTITYKVDGPQLKLNNIPDNVNVESLTVKGTVTDPTDEFPVVYLNDEELYVGWDGGFSKTLTLEEGENVLVFVAENQSGKTTEIVKTVMFSVGGPLLKVNNLPEKTNLKQLTLSGTVTDKNDESPVLTLNNEVLYVGWDGSFTREVTLDDGENTFVFKAENKNGKVSTVVKTVIFESGGPELSLDELPEVSSTDSVTISGTVSDKNDESPSVYINDEKIYVSWSGDFSQTVELAEGDNTFTIKAKNASGKVSVITRTIAFQVPGPVLKLDYLPERTSLKRLTLSGSVTDKNDENPNVYLNDEKLYVSWDGEFSKDVPLAAGANVFTLNATNNLGKMTTVTKVVYLD